MRTIFFSKNRLSKILFSNPFPQKRSDCESQQSGFVSDPKNPPWVWILWIHDPFLDLPKKTWNPFLDSEIRIGIFPNVRTLSDRYFYLSVHVVVELSTNIMRGNWGFRWWPKNALLWQISRNQNLVGMDQARSRISAPDQAVDTLRNTVSIPEGHVWSMAWAWF